VSTSNELWRLTISDRPVSSGSILVNFTNNKNVDAGSTNTYIIAIEWAVFEWSGTPDWSVSLTDLETTTYKISQYQNLGELPITENR
jgi:hypothetical protein